MRTSEIKSQPREPPSNNFEARIAQDGAAASELRCAPERHAIAETIARAITLDCSAVVNPYGDGRSAKRIVDLLRSMPPAADLLRKPFHLLEAAHV